MERDFALFGGCNVARFDISEPQSLSEDSALNLLLADIEIIDDNGQTWFGFVVSTTLILPESQASFSYTYTLEDITPSKTKLGQPRGLYNAVRAQYTGSNTTSWATEDRSIDRYGRHEYTITDTADAPQTQAEAARDSMLLTHAWPFAMPEPRGSAETAVLEVTAIGWLFSARWVEPTGSGLTTVNAWIADLIDDCPFLTAGAIASNTTSCEEIPSGSVFDALQTLVADYTDHNDNTMRLWVDQNKYVHYQPIDMTPSFYLLGPNIHDASTGLVVAPTFLAPGIYEDRTRLYNRPIPAAQLPFSNHLLIEEVGTRNDNNESTFGATGRVANMANNQHAIPTASIRTTPIIGGSVGKWSVPNLVFEDSALAEFAPDNSTAVEENDLGVG